MITSQDSFDPSCIEDQLERILNSGLNTEKRTWLHDRVQALLESPSARELYIAYTLIGQKFGDTRADLSEMTSEDMAGYFSIHGLRLAEAGRIYLLIKMLKGNPMFYEEVVQKLIEIADGKELIVLLKYLVFLPNPEKFSATATEALRTNIVPVFDAIALHNPYPRLFFNEQQWNQMYLKAAFLQRPLIEIVGVKERANEELSRIISDYAHERWAASRNIDPQIWQPVAFAPAKGTLKDIRHLLDNGSEAEIKAAVLVAANTAHEELAALVNEKPEIREEIKNKTLNWKNLKE